MKVIELVEHVNRLTDEDFDAATIVPFLNDGMAKINAECSANFPYLQIENTDVEPVLAEKWQRLLLCIFAAGRVKENDSSQFEYMDFYGQFDANMLDFKASYKIPNEYRDDLGVTTTSDIYTNPTFYWNGRW